MKHSLQFLPLALTLTSPLSARAATSYVQNFDAYANGTTNLAGGTSLVSDNGDASVQNGALRLTLTGGGEERATFRIPGLTGAAAGWTAYFSVRVGSDGVPADGFSFAWGSDIGFNPFPEGDEEGWGAEVNHLYFGFDTFDNGGGEWGLSIGGADGSSASLFTSVPGPLIGVEETALAEVFIEWSPTTGAAFRTTGFNTNINVTGIPVPGFTAADSNLFAISARTGGLTETLSIDNLAIHAVPEPACALLLLTAALALGQRRRPAVQN